jgi:hypothetical protein
MLDDAGNAIGSQPVAGEEDSMMANSFSGN